MADHPVDPKDLEKQLEAVEEEIEAAKRMHEDVDGGPKGPLWVDSGTENPDLDDQTIAPG